MLCPITAEVFVEPVVTADGHSYERAAIEQWLGSAGAARHTTSPLTNAELPSRALLPNHALRCAVAEWREAQPLVIDPLALEIREDEALGSGSFGLVVAGTLRTAGRPQEVAVKLLPLLSRQEQRRQFDRELRAHLVAQQGADRVCRVLGTCEKGGRCCLVMKRYTRSLRDVLDECAAAATTAAAADGDRAGGGCGGGCGGGLPPKVVRHYGRSICRTVAQLHAAGVVVQDIKPENILLDEWGVPVLADFGISAVVQRTTRVTPSTVKGTFNYMAPEAFEPPLGAPACNAA
eukprot:SAG22_NODE_1026_length_5964_cov_7.098039_3_plen_291_part_00